MNKSILIFVALIWMLELQAQEFSGHAREKMAVFEHMIGEWEGEGWAVTYTGDVETTQVHEQIMYDLNKTVIRMHGKGTQTKDGKERVTHDALGVLYYDLFSWSYKMDSWIAKGMHAHADFEVLETGKYQWSFEAGQAGTMRYTITFEGDKWHEIGERSTDGESWFTFFEMNLKKISK